MAETKQPKKYKFSFEESSSDIELKYIDLDFIHPKCHKCGAYMDLDFKVWDWKCTCGNQIPRLCAVIEREHCSICDGVILLPYGSRPGNRKGTAIRCEPCQRIEHRLKNREKARKCDITETELREKILFMRKIKALIQEIS